MIYPVQTLDHSVDTSQTNSAKSGGQASFRLQSGQNERTNGSMPVWEKSPQFSLPNGAENASYADLSLGLQSEQAANSTNSKDSSFGFLDFLDIINPLQHIPIIGTIYRHITGDEIGAVAQVAGGALFGGPIGAAAGVASAVVSHETGKDLGDTLAGLLSPSHDLDTLDGTTIAFADLTRTRSAYNS
ncbi:MAG: hypothetical protein KDJ26_01550 [Alphaproteobacteria bacterium]|jgi:hypothetical protein|nr:hypothetical protein [Alphaproteobacteria bacterium]MCB1550664.1 hypothetical protein [Alphaproteobacteria bacterium]MCB9985738.1 hypothetical protein [Micavibrio sp.]HPQ50925.1 hypothetical protein [Alphaproteobacteria bacterium]HRK97630.1 hypothetical protein [Alphaproteobacteria bacterium]